MQHLPQPFLDPGAAPRSGSHGGDLNGDVPPPATITGFGFGVHMHSSVPGMSLGSKHGGPYREGGCPRRTSPCQAVANATVQLLKCSL